MRLRILLHAVDRTGPARLALAFVEWLASARPDVEIDLVSFRGGELRSELERFGPLLVLLRPHEPWDHAAPDPQRHAEVRALAAGLARADVTLLVSVAAAQCLTVVDDASPVVTWSVEQGSDLHWVDDGIGLAERTTRWLAGTELVAGELALRLPTGTDVSVVPEFVASPPPAEVLAPAASAHRAALGLGAGDRLVVGAGIATVRKAPDLFVEVALACLRDDHHAPPVFAWIGGERDELHLPLRREVERLGIGDRVRVLPDVADIEAWLLAADVFLHPARLDAFPLVCLHAAAVGTPVVAFSGVGGVPLMLGPHFRGAPYPDVPALAGCVAALADPEEGAALGRRQQAHVEARYLAPVAGPLLLRHLEAVA